MFLYLVFRSSHIWLDIQLQDLHLKTLTRTFKALRKHLGIWALGGHSEGIWAIGKHSKGTWALRHLGHSGAWALKALRHLRTRAFGHLGHLASWALGHSRHLGTPALEALYLAVFIKSSFSKTKRSFTRFNFFRTNGVFKNRHNGQSCRLISDVIEITKMK